MILLFRLVIANYIAYDLQPIRNIVCLNNLIITNSLENDMIVFVSSCYVG